MLAPRSLLPPFTGRLVQAALRPRLHCPADGLTVAPPDFRALHRVLLQHTGYRSGGARRLAAAQLTPDWLRQNGGFRPVLVPAAPTAAADAGLRLPPGGSLTPERLAARLGPATEVQTVDTQSQGDGPRWTLHQWSLYWDARRALSKDAGGPVITPRAAVGRASAAAGPDTAAHGGAPAAAAGAAAAAPAAAAAAAAGVAEDEADSAAVTRRRPSEEQAAAALGLKGISSESRRRLLEVAALPLVGTPLEGEVGPPAAVAAVDLWGMWPTDTPNRPAPGTFLRLRLGPEGVFSDFALAAGGAGLWLHLVSGSKVGWRWCWDPWVAGQGLPCGRDQLARGHTLVGGSHRPHRCSWACYSLCCLPTCPYHPASPPLPLCCSHADVCTHPPHPPQPCHLCGLGLGPAPGRRLPGWPLRGGAQGGGVRGGHAASPRRLGLCLGHHRRGGGGGGHLPAGRLPGGAAGGVED